MPDHREMNLARLEAAAAGLVQLDRISYDLADSGYELLWIKVRMPAATREDALVIAKALGPDGGPMIAIVGGSSPVMALERFVYDARDDKLRWKPDKFAV